MSLFPGSLPPAGTASSTATLAAAGHTALHNNDRDEIRALATKLGTGSATASSGTVLRGNGAGTSTWGQVVLTTDVTGILPVANGGTGQSTLTGLPLASPAISGTVSGGATYSSPTISGMVSGGATYTSPVLATPTIADYTNATHTHQNNSGGGTLAFASLISTIFSGQVTTYTNPGSAGGTNSFFYINLGGIKLFWGVSDVINITTTGTPSAIITLPVGFFSTIQTACATSRPGIDVRAIVNITGVTTTQMEVYAFNTAGVTSSAIPHVLVIGT